MTSTTPALTSAAPETADRGRRAAAPAPTRQVLLAVLVTVVAWASAFVAIRGVRDSLSPAGLALGRLAVGSAALGITVAVRRCWVRPTPREWGLMVVVGVSWFAIYNVALNAAEQRVDAGTASMLVNIGPVIVALLAARLLGEGLPRWLVIGTGISFAGAVLIGIATSTRAGADVTGVLFCLVAAVGWPIGVTAQKPVLRRLPALQVTAVACTVGALVCLPAVGSLTSSVRTSSAGALAGVVYLGLVPTAIAFGTWAYALARTPAGRLGVTSYLVSPLVVLLAWPLLSETPPLLALAGGALALLGVALTRRR